MTNEPPKGLKQNIRNFYYNQNNKSLDETNKPEAYRKLLFGLAMFHANVQVSSTTCIHNSAQNENASCVGTSRLKFRCECINNTYV